MTETPRDDYDTPWKEIAVPSGFWTRRTWMTFGIDGIGCFAGRGQVPAAYQAPAGVAESWSCSAFILSLYDETIASSCGVALRHDR
jgi:hypothetical protein